LVFASYSSSFFLVADLSAGAGEETERNDDGNDHNDGGNTSGAREFVLHGNHASLSRGTSGDVTVPPPVGRLAETLAFEFSLNGLHELGELSLASFEGSAFSSLGSVEGNVLGFLGVVLDGLVSGGVGLDTFSFLSFGGSVKLGEALVEVLDFTVEHKAVVGTLVVGLALGVSVVVDFPGRDSSLHVSGVALETGSSNGGTGAGVFAHGGGRGNSDGTIGILDGRSHELVSLLDTHVKFVNGEVLVLAEVSLSIGQKFVGDRSFFLGGLEESGSRGRGGVVVSSGGAHLVDHVLTNCIDHEDGDSDNEHEDNHRGEGDTVDEGAAGLLLLLDETGDSSNNDEVDTHNVKETLSSFDKVLERSIKSFQVEEVVDEAGVSGDDNSHDDHDKTE